MSKLFSKKKERKKERKKRKENSIPDCVLTKQVLHDKKNVCMKQNTHFIGFRATSYVSIMNR
jgi:hypothetical protein